jgi:hypothetical protein
MSARVFEFDEFIFLAKLLDTKPNSSIACCTFSRVAGATISGRLSTLETVPIETRALRATWRTLTVMTRFFAFKGDKSRKALFYAGILGSLDVKTLNSSKVNSHLNVSTLFFITKIFSLIASY